MPFCHLKLSQPKPNNTSYLWKASRYPEHPRHIGELILKHRHDHKIPAHVCQKMLGVDKSTLTNWENGRHKPNREHLGKIRRFLNGSSSFV